MVIMEKFVCAYGKKGQNVFCSIQNSLIVVGDCYAAKPSAQTPDNGFGQALWRVGSVSEHQHLHKNLLLFCFLQLSTKTCHYHQDYTQHHYISEHLLLFAHH